MDKTGLPELILILFGVVLVFTIIALLFGETTLFILGLFLCIIYSPFVFTSVGKILERGQYSG